MANFQKLNGGVPYVVSDDWGFETAVKVQDDLAMLAQGQLGRNRSLGGSFDWGYRSVAYVDIPNAVYFTVDNTSSQWSGSSGITVTVTVYMRVLSGSVEPSIYNVTDGVEATFSGGAVCSGTANDFSGTNQKQTLTLTLASGTKTYVVQAAGNSDDTVWFASAWMGMHIS